MLRWTTSTRWMPPQRPRSALRSLVAAFWAGVNDVVLDFIGLSAYWTVFAHRTCTHRAASLRWRSHSAPRTQAWPWTKSFRRVVRMQDVYIYILNTAYRYYCIFTWLMLMPKGNIAKVLPQYLSEWATNQACILMTQSYCVTLLNLTAQIKALGVSVHSSCTVSSATATTGLPTFAVTYASR